MSTSTENYGLFINFDYCTGCHSCEVACKKEHGLPEGQWGIRVLRDGPRRNGDGSWDYTYLPLPTGLCDLCAERVSEGRLPTCVHHCQARVMRFGPYADLAKLLPGAPRSVVYAV